MAQYLAGEYGAAVESLTRFTELNADALVSRAEAEGFLFLAMAHWQLGNREQATPWFDKAVDWMQQHHDRQPDHRQLLAEAAKLLGVEVPEIN